MAMMHENGVHRCKEAYESAKQQVEQAYEETEHMVRENPFSAALTAFSVGIGVGMLVTYAMLPPRRQTWQKMGENSARHFADALAQFLPESVARRFQG